MDKPSIFNDVLGPIMIGPSSSHVAAALRIGRMVRPLVTHEALSVVVEFAFDGSLVTTYHSQGSDRGFACGLLGFQPDDPRSSHGLELVKDFIPLSFQIINESAPHPNDYKVTVNYKDHQQVLRAISSGGGAIEVYEVMGVPVSLKGGRYELMAVCDQADIKITTGQLLRHNDITVLHISSATPISPSAINQIQHLDGIGEAFLFEPVMPVCSYDDYSYTFSSCRELYDLPDLSKAPLSYFAMQYEVARSHSDADCVLENAEKVLSVMSKAIENGRSPQYYADRILPSQAYKIAQNRDKLFPCDLINQIIASITAVMESKSSMYPIVAAPTAGSCGCLPGTLFAACGAINATPEQKQRALLAAGLVGAFFADQATFAAEVGGCQMECGAASGMTAAALAELMGAPASVAVCAAAIALQGITGLACDPVASRVESPCLNKNIMAGVNALTSANMALAGFDAVIPLYETIDAIYEIGKSLPASLRCTCGGLGCTPTSRTLQKQLEDTNAFDPCERSRSENG